MVQSNLRLYEGQSSGVNSADVVLQKEFILTSAKLDGVPMPRSGELRLLRLHLFLDHRFHNGLQNLTRNRLQNLGIQLCQYLSDEVIHARGRSGGSCRSWSF